MSRFAIVLFLGGAAALVSGCAGSPTAPAAGAPTTATAGPVTAATAGPATTATAGPATAAGECRIIGVADGTWAYTRPSTGADAFGILDATELPLPVVGRSDGWLGFEPGVAQAANVGVFRLRWISADEVEVEGDCAAVPEVSAPQQGVCYTMPMDDTVVHAAPDPASVAVTTLVPGQYAAVVGTTGAGWALLDLSEGNVGTQSSGWVTADSLNLNGPCDGLPTVVP
jgi:hypothetical protein